MPPQTLKRQAGDVSFSNDDLDDDEYTWGNKKSRYLYTYNLQSDLISNIHTESNSIQSKSTTDNLNFSSETSSFDCDFQTSSDCGSLNSSKYDPKEFEITKVTIPDIQLLPHYKNCIKCRKENSNPRFQYCFTCFNFRKQLFDSKPNPKPKSIKRLVDMTVEEDNNLQGDSSGSVTSNSQESVSMGISGLCLSKENMTELNVTNRCNVCYLKQKNGIFNHGDTAHMYCCYGCAKQIWKRSGRCPICNLKIRYVTKAVFS